MKLPASMSASYIQIGDAVTRESRTRLPLATLKKCRSLLSSSGTARFCMTLALRKAAFFALWMSAGSLEASSSLSAALMSACATPEAFRAGAQISDSLPCGLLSCTNVTGIRTGPAAVSSAWPKPETSYCQRPILNSLPCGFRHSHLASSQQGCMPSTVHCGSSQPICSCAAVQSGDIHCTGNIMLDLWSIEGARYGVPSG